MFHESTRKDVEQYFGILQKKGTIIEKPSRQWYLDTIFDSDVHMNYPSQHNHKR
jgi:hypothetical protein